MSTKVISIGGASGFWGDSSQGALQLARSGQVDYLTFDYLAEVTLSLLAKARSRDPEAGYATDFVDVLRALVPCLRERKLKLVANAGGINPAACARALAAVALEGGLDLKIAAIEGDDVSPLVDALRREGVREMFSGAPFPDRVLSASAYLGAGPIAAALDRGADIVVTGRVVDSALSLGILIHEFGWQADDWNRLAAGSLAGHILECGAQATGGNYTDWEQVPDWANIGYPIAQCHADGSFVVTKPENTGGLVTVSSVAEQMLYEIGDPGAYILPDVTADFSRVTLRQEGENRVRVSGARGRPSPSCYKVCTTFVDGARLFGSLSIIGIDAVKKAHRTADAILERSRRLLKEQGFADFRRTLVEVLGSESLYGPHSRARNAREVVMKLAAEHESPEALDLLAREIASAVTSFAPGTTGFAGGRPKPSPVVRLFSCLLPKDRLPAPRVTLDGETWPVPLPRTAHLDIEALSPPVESRRDAATPASGAPDSDSHAPGPSLPLVRLAWVRAGDKGDRSNIGVIPRRPEYTDLLRRELTVERVAAYFAHLAEGPVRRFEVPGIGGFNFLIERALGGGGMASLRDDALGKGMAQMLLDLEIPLPPGGLTHAEGGHDNKSRV